CFSRKSTNNRPVAANHQIGYGICRDTAVGLLYTARSRYVFSVGIVGSIGILGRITAGNNIDAGRFYSIEEEPWLELQQPAGLCHIREPGIAISAGGNGVVIILSAITCKKVVVVAAAKVKSWRMAESEQPRHIDRVERLQAVTQIPVCATIRAFVEPAVARHPNDPGIVLIQLAVLVIRRREIAGLQRDLEIRREDQCMRISMDPNDIRVVAISPRLRRISSSQ